MDGCVHVLIGQCIWYRTEVLVTPSALRPSYQTTLGRVPIATRVPVRGGVGGGGTHSRACRSR